MNIIDTQKKLLQEFWNKAGVLCNGLLSITIEYEKILAAASSIWKKNQQSISILIEFFHEYFSFLKSKGGTNRKIFVHMREYWNITSWKCARTFHNHFDNNIIPPPTPPPPTKLHNLLINVSPVPLVNDNEAGSVCGDWWWLRKWFIEEINMVLACALEELISISKGSKWSSNGEPTGVEGFSVQPSSMHFDDASEYVSVFIWRVTTKYCTNAKFTFMPRGSLVLCTIYSFCIVLVNSGAVLIKLQGKTRNELLFNLFTFNNCYFRIE